MYENFSMSTCYKRNIMHKASIISHITYIKTNMGNDCNKNENDPNNCGLRFVTVYISNKQKLTDRKILILPIDWLMIFNLNASLFFLFRFQIFHSRLPFQFLNCMHYYSNSLSTSYEPWPRMPSDSVIWYYSFRYFAARNS